MVRNPEVQQKAHDEIDAVVGRGRLPTLEDRKSLPYLEAIYLEVVRIRPAGPMGMCTQVAESLTTFDCRFTGLPHHTTEDDFYNGYYIPKGILLIKFTIKSI